MNPRYRIIGHFNDLGTSRAFYLTTRKDTPGRSEYVPMEWIEDREFTDTTAFASFTDANVWQWAKWAIGKTKATRVEVIKLQPKALREHQISMSNTVKARQTIERAIATRFVKDTLAAGYRLGVSLERGYDVDDGMLNGSVDETKILDEIFAGDECHVFVQPGDGPVVDSDGTVVSIGWVYFVLGNDGYDVISDYLLSKTLEAKLIKGANDLATKIENGEFQITV